MEMVCLLTTHNYSSLAATRLAVAHAFSVCVEHQTCTAYPSCSSCTDKGYNLCISPTRPYPLQHLRRTFNIGKQLHKHVPLLQDGFLVTTTSGQKFENVDLSEGEWVEYDEKLGESVGIMELEHKLVVHK